VPSSQAERAPLPIGQHRQRAYAYSIGVSLEGLEDRGRGQVPQLQCHRHWRRGPAVQHRRHDGELGHDRGFKILIASHATY
jgi:hypothetical protein